MVMGILAMRAVASDITPLGYARIEKTESREASSVFINSGYFRLSSSAGVVTGLEFNLGYRYAQSDSVALGTRMRQAASPTDGFATLFTALQIEIDYALWGHFGKQQRSIELDGQRVYRYKNSNSGVLVANFGMSQFFLNTSEFSVPFSGVGCGLRYDLPTQWATILSVGTGIDRLTNSKLQVIPFQFYFGLAQLL